MSAVWPATKTRHSAWLWRPAEVERDPADAVWDLAEKSAGISPAARAAASPSPAARRDLEPVDPDLIEPGQHAHRLAPEQREPGPRGAEAGERGGHPHQERFRDHLAHQSRAARAQRRADAELPHPPERLAHQRRGQVHAGHQQHTQRRGEQDAERLSHGTHHVVGQPCDQDLVRVGRLAVGLLDARGEAVHLGARPFQTHAGGEARHHVVAVRGAGAQIVGALEGCPHGHVLPRPAVAQEAEAPGQHAHHLEALVAQAEGELIQRASAELVGPESPAHQGHGGASGCVFVGREIPPQRRCDAQHLEESPGHAARERAHRAVGEQDGTLVGRRRGGHPVQDAAGLVAPVTHVGERGPVRLVRVRDLAQAHQAVGRVEGERPQYDVPHQHQDQQRCGHPEAQDARREEGAPRVAKDAPGGGAELVGDPEAGGGLGHGELSRGVGVSRSRYDTAKARPMFGGGGEGEVGERAEPEAQAGEGPAGVVGAAGAVGVAGRVGRSPAIAEHLDQLALGLTPEARGQHAQECPVDPLRPPGPVSPPRPGRAAHHTAPRPGSRSPAVRSVRRSRSASAASTARPSGVRP